MDDAKADGRKVEGASSCGRNSERRGGFPSRLRYAERNRARGGSGYFGKVATRRRPTHHRLRADLFRGRRAAPTGKRKTLLTDPEVCTDTFEGKLLVIQSHEEDLKLIEGDDGPSAIIWRISKRAAIAAMEKRIEEEHGKDPS